MKPYRVLLFIVACLGVLALLCVVLPHRVQLGSRTLRWPTLSEVLETADKPDNSEYADDSLLEEFPEAPDSLLAAVDTVAAPEPVAVQPAAAQPAEAQPVASKPQTAAVDSVDTRQWLAPF